MSAKTKHDDGIDVTGGGATLLKSASFSQRRVLKATLLGICYSSSLGGTATLTGTAPNLVLMGQLEA